jgi:hypothetical protein
VSAGLLAALRASGILHLWQAAAASDAAYRGLYVAISSLRAAALRLLVAVAAQMRGSRDAMSEIARLVGAQEEGCLGERAYDILHSARLEGLLLLA